METERHKLQAQVRRLCEETTWLRKELEESQQQLQDAEVELAQLREEKEALEFQASLARDDLHGVSVCVGAGHSHQALAGTHIVDRFASHVLHRHKQLSSPRASLTSPSTWTRQRRALWKTLSRQGPRRRRGQGVGQGLRRQPKQEALRQLQRSSVASTAESCSTSTRWSIHTHIVNVCVSCTIPVNKCG